ncbi:MAG: DUF881 domain-containing protein [Armatimonadota bacterium]
MKMHVPLEKPQPWVLPVTLVCLALGALIALLMISSTKQEIDPNSMRPEQLALLFAQAKKENDTLQDEIGKLRGQIDSLINATASEQKQKEALMKEINYLRMRGGSTAVEGPGIVITLDDTDMIKPNRADVNANAYLTHDVDLLLLVNELRSAGAEAIAVNDQRVVGSSAIRCVGPAIRINDHQIAPPFVIEAIGKADTLYGAVNLPFGVLDQLKPLGIHIEVVKREVIRVPALTVLPPLEVGKVVTDSGVKK